MNQQLEDILGQIAKSIAYVKGVNLLYGKYGSQPKLKAVDDKNNILEVGVPTLVFDRRDMEGTPIHLYFKMQGDIIRMRYEFRVETQAQGAKPMLFSDVSPYLHIKSADGSETSEYLKNFVTSDRPQIISGEKDWKGIDEFLKVKESIEKGNAYISWTGKVQWVDVSTPEMQEAMKKPDFKPQPQTVEVKGTLPIEVTSNSASHTSMFDGVKNLLRWDYEILNERKVYFKDPLKDDAIYFLPQEYRIKALENNAPDMSTEIVTENGERKVLMRFRIGPFVHPNAKRDAYNIFLKRKGKKYCELRYGGYESARFQWGGEMTDGRLYGKEGFTSITSEGDIHSAPESSFFIVLKTPTDGLVKLFQEKIMQEGIVVGNVYFKVTDGVKNDLIELDPIPVKLDFHKLTGIEPDVRITSCKWPNYIAQITNMGQYPIEVGGAALSILRKEKNQVKDAKHELKTNTTFPTTLAKGQSMSVQLTSEQAESLKHRKFFGLGKVDENFWTDFICEPYHIRTTDETLKDTLVKTNESATYEHKQWELTVITNFHWYDYPDLTAVQVEIKTKYGLDETITMTEGGEKPKISMVSNLEADLNTQQAGNQTFEFRVRAITKNGPRNPEWGEWATESGDTLFIYSDDVKPKNT